MPRGVKKTLHDKVFDLARTATVNEFVTAVAEMFAVSLKGNSPIKLHEIFGEMNVRAQLMLRDLQEFEAAQKATARKPKPKSLATITARASKATPRKKAGSKPAAKRVYRRKAA